MKYMQGTCEVHAWHAMWMRRSRRRLELMTRALPCTLPPVHIILTLTLTLILTLILTLTLTLTLDDPPRNPQPFPRGQGLTLGVPLT